MSVSSLEILPLGASVRRALREAARALRRIYGERLVRLVLFGSQVRGEAGAESDVDVLVVLQGDFRLYEEVKRTSALVMHASLEHDVTLSLLFLPDQQYQNPNHPLMINVGAEGLVL